LRLPGQGAISTPFCPGSIERFPNPLRFAASAVARAIDASNDSAGKVNCAKTLLGMFRSATSLLVVIGHAAMLLDEIGIPIGPFLGGAAVIGLAVAFGAQSIIKDYFPSFPSSRTAGGRRRMRHVATGSPTSARATSCTARHRIRRLAGLDCFRGGRNAIDDSHSIPDNGSFAGKAKTAGAGVDFQAGSALTGKGSHFELGFCGIPVFADTADGRKDLYNSGSAFFEACSFS
jgi:hypothetical protein